MGKLQAERFICRLRAGLSNVVAQLDTIVPVEKLEIFWNGKPVETVPVASNARTMRIEKTIPVHESGWLTLRATRRPESSG